MKIGFIGAGKVGTNLGRYFDNKGWALSGFYSKHYEDAIFSARQTNSHAFSELSECVAASDWLFITVPDDQLLIVWQEVESLLTREYCLFHCSGSKSSAIFATEKAQIACFSLHPLTAFATKSVPLEQLAQVAFTLEGDQQQTQVQAAFANLENPLAVISAEDKSLYHAAGIFASSLVVGLATTAQEIFQTCGLPEAFAKSAWRQVFTQNAMNLVLNGPKESLSGPIEENDLTTIIEHLAVLSPEDAKIYCELTKKLIKLAAEKYPERDYQFIEEKIDQ